MAKKATTEVVLRKDEIVQRLSEKGYTKKDASVIVDDMVAVIMEAMAKGESVAFMGFGTFTLREMAAHDITQVKTGEKVHVPAFKTPKFVPGVTLRKAVRDGVVPQKAEK